MAIQPVLVNDLMFKGFMVIETELIFHIEAPFGYTYSVTI